MNTQLIALFVAALGVSCFTVVFSLLFINYRKFAVNEVKSGKRDIELIEEYFSENQASVKKRKKVLKIVKLVLYVVLMIFIFVCLVFALVVKFVDKLPVGTKTVMVVATPSMSSKNTENEYLFDEDLKKQYDLENQFPALSLIFLEVVSEDSIGLYDVVAYNHPDGRVIIHRIVRVEETETGTRYRTRGDANSTDDQKEVTYNVIVNYDNIVGRYTGVYIPLLGAFVLFMQSMSGIVTVIALIICLIIFDRNSASIADARDDRTNYLLQVLDVDNLHEESEISVDFVEKIYLDKVAYSLDNNGVVSKEVAEEVLKKYNEESNEGSNEGSNEESK